MGMRLANGNWSDALADTPENQAKYGSGSGYSGSAGYNAPQYGVASSSSGGSGGGSGRSGTSGGSPSSGSDGGLNALLSALAAGNKAAADQAAAQFAQTFGLDSQKFQESVRQYNQNFGLAQAGLTGSYNGQQTLAAQKQAADAAAQAAGLTGFFNGQATLAEQELMAKESGMFNGQQTEAGREFDVTAAQNALDQSNRTGLGVLNLASSLHADPFRQLQVMYGANGIDGVNRAVQGVIGPYGLSGGGFTAPGGSNTANLGGLASSYNNAGTMGTTPSAMAAATGLNNTNQIIARNYNPAPQNVKDFTTSALSANTGLDQASVDRQIQNNLPKFKSPDFGLATI